MDNVKEYYEKLLNLLDWSRAAAFLGPISFMSCVALGVLTLFSGGPEVGWIVCLYTILAGVVIGLWEWPTLYSICHEKDAGPLGTIDINAIRTRLWEDYNIKASKTRAMLYAGLAVYPLFAVSGLCLYSGITLFINSVCLLLSHLSEARFEGASYAAVRSTDENDNENFVP